MKSRKFSSTKVSGYTVGGVKRKGDKIAIGPCRNIVCMCIIG